jgi:hypothetical protein
VHASHEALTLVTRCECLKRHGVGEREGEVGADFSSIVLPRKSGSRSRGLRGAAPFVPEMRVESKGVPRPVNALGKRTC